MDDKALEVFDIMLKIDNIQNAISTTSTEVNKKTYASVVTGVDLGKEVDIDTLFAEQTQRNVKEKILSYLVLTLTH